MEDQVQIIKLDSLPKGSFIHSLAEANLKHKGFYGCTYKGVKTEIQL